MRVFSRFFWCLASRLTWVTNSRYSSYWRGQRGVQSLPVFIDELVLRVAAGWLGDLNGSFHSWVYTLECGKKGDSLLSLAEGAGLGSSEVWDVRMFRDTVSYSLSLDMDTSFPEVTIARLGWCFLEWMNRKIRLSTMSPFESLQSSRKGLGPTHPHAFMWSETKSR